MFKLDAKSSKNQLDTIRKVLGAIYLLIAVGMQPYLLHLGILVERRISALTPLCFVKHNGRDYDVLARTAKL